MITGAKPPAHQGIGTTTGLAGRIVRGAGALSVSAAVTVVGQIAIVPVALALWGRDRYGEWLLLTGLVSVLRLTDLGLQTFVVNRLGQAYARRDIDAMRWLLGSALRVHYPMMLVLLVVIGGAATLLPVQDYLGLHSIDHQEITFVAVLMAAEVLIAVPMGVVGGLYRATGRLPRAGIIGALQQLALIGATVSLIGADAPFWLVAAARVAVMLAMSAAIFIDLRRQLGWIEVLPTWGTVREGLSMIVPGLFFLLIPLSDYLATQLGLLIVQRDLSPAEVSRLATHRTMVNVAQMVSGILMNSAWPELTALRARDRRPELIQLQFTLAKTNLWLVGAVLLLGLPFMPMVYPSWTVGRLVLDPWLLALLTLRLLVWAVWSPSLTMLLATNQQRLAALCLLGSSLMTALFTALLVPLLGIIGAGLGPLVGDVLLCAWLIPRLSLRDVGADGGAFVRMIARASSSVGIPTLLGAAAWLLTPWELARYLVVLPVATALAVVLICRSLTETEQTLARQFYARAGITRPLQRLWRGAYGARLRSKTQE